MPFDLFDTIANSIFDAKIYAHFKEELIKSNCSKCELSKSRTHIVVDRGNPNAKVVIIGEGPGENEDKQAKAFVGRAGQLLDKLMKEVGFDANEESLIINVVKCRPPENRQPSQKEADTCLPYLKKQLEIVKPEIIILLGATALKHIIHDKKYFAMGSEAGKFFRHADYPGVEFMVLYHPAYILRDPRKTPLMQEHLKRFKQFWNQKQSPVIYGKGMRPCGETKRPA